MFFLSPVPGIPDRRHFRSNHVSEVVLHFANHFVGLSHLFLIMVQDNRAVLGTLISTLLVQGGRVMGLEESQEQLFVTDDLCVISDLDHFSMACCPTAYFTVSGVLGGATRIPRHYLLDADNLRKNAFSAPEAATSESSQLFFWHLRKVFHAGRALIALLEDHGGHAVR